MANLKEKFYSDPDWAEVESLLQSKMVDLFDMNSVDLQAPAEHVKAEIIGRKLAYNALADFLSETGFVRQTIKKVDPNWSR